MNIEVSKFFRFCPSCSAKLGVIENRLIVCKSCGFHYYLNPVMTVAAILEKTPGEILLVERKYDPKKGFWDLPGGFVDTHENIEEAMYRELMEELGVRPEKLHYIGSTTDLYQYKGVNYNTIIALYKGKISEKVTPADDAASVKFFTKKSYDKKKFAFTKLSEMIENYFEQ